MAPHPANLDRTGVLASVFCAIHCAIAPALLLAMPTLGGPWAHPLSHLAIAAFVLPVAACALRSGFRSHRRRWVVALGGLGIALVFGGAALPYVSAAPGAAGPLTAHAAEAHAAEAHAAGACASCGPCCPSFVVDPATGVTTLHIPWATVVTMAGGIALVVAHAANLRCCARCRTG